MRLRDAYQEVTDLGWYIAELDADLVLTKCKFLRPLHDAFNIDGTLIRQKSHRDVAVERAFAEQSSAAARKIEHKSVVGP